MTYIEIRFEKKFKKKDCTPTIAPIIKGDKFNHKQCLQNNLEKEKK